MSRIKYLMASEIDWSRELHYARLQSLVNDPLPCVLRPRESLIELSLISTHFPLRFLKALAKMHLALQENVFSAGRIARFWREQGDTWGLADAARESTCLAVRRLRPVNLPQALFELIDLLDLLVAVDGQSALVEANVAVAACAIAMVLDGARVDDRGGWVISAPRVEGCDWWRVGGRVGLVEATVVSLDKCVATRAVGEVVHVEGAGEDLRVAQLVRVLAGKHVGLGDTIDGRLLQH